MARAEREPRRESPPREPTTRDARSSLVRPQAALHVQDRRRVVDPPQQGGIATARREPDDRECRAAARGGLVLGALAAASPASERVGPARRAGRRARRAGRAIPAAGRARRARAQPCAVHAGQQAPASTDRVSSPRHHRGLRRPEKGGLIVGRGPACQGPAVGGRSAAATAVRVPVSALSDAASTASTRRQSASSSQWRRLVPTPWHRLALPTGAELRSDLAASGAALHAR